MQIVIIMGPFGYIPPKGIGAIEKLWYDLALEFIKKGHGVEIISKKPVGFQVSDTGNEDIEHIYIPGYRSGAHLAKDLFFDFIYSFNALRKVKKTDILIMNTFWSPLLCRLFRYKYSVSVYNVARYPKGQYRYYCWTDMFCCVSTAVERALKKQLPDKKDKIRTINNPIDTNIYTYREKETTDDLIIMYHGRIHPEKGLNILVLAVETLRVKYPGINLVFVGARDIASGGGGEQYVRQLEKMAKGRITWADPISNPSLLAEKIASCDIYCYPSVAEKGETFGVSPLEAMGIGRPVIVSALECFNDFIEDGVNGFVFDHRSPNAVEELASIIEQLMEHPDWRKEIGVEAFRSSRRFSNSHIADQYLSEFKILLNNHG